MNTADDSRRRLFSAAEAKPVPEKSDTLTLINKRGDRIVVLPWAHWGGIAIGNQQALVVFSYWLVHITGLGLHELKPVFEGRCQKELATSKRTDKFERPDGRFQIDEITVEC